MKIRTQKCFSGFFEMVIHSKIRHGHFMHGLAARMFLALCLFLAVVFGKGLCKIYAEELTMEEVVAGRKILFVRTIYPFSTEKGETLKGNEKGIPKGIAIDAEGKLFAIFLDRMKIQVFNNDGRFRYEFGEKGKGEGKYLLPLDIEISEDGRVFVLDSRQQKIIIYSNKGNFLSEFSIDYGRSGGEVPVTATKMGLDKKNGIIYIADTSNSVIRRFALTGEYIDSFGRFGHGEGEFSFPGQAAFNSSGNIYVLDMANTRVQVFGPDRKFKSSFGGFGDLLGEFVRPNAIVIDSKGRIYVLDRLISAIQVFDQSGNVLGVIKDLEELNLLKDAAPFDMAIDQEDRIYISAQDYHSIKVIKDLE
ncbi:NHL repeat-containing protein [bacterium]|nr:NHL repeat-containing protein [bacterium]